jgi:hypothetical protein
MPHVSNRRCNFNTIRIFVLSLNKKACLMNMSAAWDTSIPLILQEMTLKQGEVHTSVNVSEAGKWRCQTLKP